MVLPLGVQVDQRIGNSLYFRGVRFVGTCRPRRDKDYQYLYKRYRRIIYAVRMSDSVPTMTPAQILDMLPRDYYDTYNRLRAPARAA